MKALSALVACALVVGFAAPAFAAASTDLGVAASVGDTGKIKSLIGAGQNINIRDSEGYTALMWAALNGQVNAVSTLITLGANLNIQDREGYTALMWATQNKHETIVRQLLNAGASVNLRDNHGYAALHWAAQDGQLYIAQMLLQRGADPNVRDVEGYTPLMWAAQQGHGPVVYELLAHNANPGFRDRRGYTAYDLANAYYHPEIRKMIKGYRTPGLAAAPAPARQPQPVAVAEYNPGIAAAAPVAVVHPQRLHQRVVQLAPPVQLRSGVRPKLVAVVNPSADGAVYVAQPQTVMAVGQPAVRTAWWGAALEARLAKYDVDKNRTIDGKDWKNLVNTTSRIALAELLYESRGGKDKCSPAEVDRIMNKLDWVYSTADRQSLTLNQAWDLPAPKLESIRW